MTTTTNLADFGFREIKMARDLLDAWVSSGLPSDFSTEGVTVMMNQNSGNVFLTNEEFEVAMESEGKLYSFYTSPYNGEEGSFEDLLSGFEHMHSDDKEWFFELSQRLGRQDELPTEEGEE
jgi:hypothetical protein